MNRSLIGFPWLLALIASTAFLAFAPGCQTATRAIDATTLGPARQVQVYERGKPISERLITAGSAEEGAVAAWLRSHADGWRTSVVTYAPGRRVQGENFDLNFHQDKCVLNYRANAKAAFVQVSRPLSENEPLPDVFTPNED